MSESTTPCGERFFEVKRGKPPRPPRSDGPGTIYVLTNPSFKKNVVKIGRTGRALGVHQRAKELHTTGVPTPFEVAFSTDVEEMIRVEREVHRELEKYRVDPRREFFEVPLHVAVACVKRRAGIEPGLLSRLFSAFTLKQET